MEQEIKKLKDEIEKLKQEVISERMVKNSEVLLNKEFRFTVHKLKTERDALLKINKEYLDKIASLELLLDKV
jgi:cell division protein FtsB